MFKLIIHLVKTWQFCTHWWMTNLIATTHATYRWNCLLSYEQRTVCYNKIIGALIGPIMFQVVIQPLKKCLKIKRNLENVVNMCCVKLTFTLIPFQSLCFKLQYYPTYQAPINLLEQTVHNSLRLMFFYKIILNSTLLNWTSLFSKAHTTWNCSNYQYLYTYNI